MEHKKNAGGRELEKYVFDPSNSLSQNFNHNVNFEQF